MAFQVMVMVKLKHDRSTFFGLVSESGEVSDRLVAWQLTRNLLHSSWSSAEKKGFYCESTRGYAKFGVISSHVCN